MKIPHMVLSLTAFGFFSVEVASAQERTEGASPPPRFRFGIEQTIGSFRHASFRDGGPTESALIWGYGTTGLSADFRVGNRLELGLAAAVSGTHSQLELSSNFETGSSENALRLKPRAGVAIEVARDLELVPRLGVEYMHALTKSETTGFLTVEFVNKTFGVTPGLMLEYAPTNAPIFLGTGAEANYGIYTSLYDGEDSGWFSDQPIAQWSLNWFVSAGGRI